MPKFAATYHYANIFKIPTTRMSKNLIDIDFSKPPSYTLNNYQTQLCWTSYLHVVVMPPGLSSIINYVCVCVGGGVKIPHDARSQWSVLIDPVKR